MEEMVTTNRLALVKALREIGAAIHEQEVAERATADELDQEGGVSGDLDNEVGGEESTVRISKPFSGEGNLQKRLRGECQSPLHSSSGDG